VILRRLGSWPQGVRRVEKGLRREVMRLQCCKAGIHNMFLPQNGLFGVGRLQLRHRRFCPPSLPKHPLQRLFVPGNGCRSLLSAARYQVGHHI